MSPHRASLVRIVVQHGWTTGAELGIDKGILFGMLLESVPALRLIGVDVCPVPHRKARCEAIAARYADRATLLVTTTDDAARVVDDRSLDFVFIDADHSLAAVKQDIADWLPKVKGGGLISGHDIDKFQVERAVRDMLPHFEVAPNAVWYWWKR